MIGRRGILSAMAASGTALALGAVPPQARGPHAFAHRMLSMLRHPESLATIGVRAAQKLRPGPRWSDAETPLGPGLTQLAEIDDAELLRLLQARIDEDFSRGRVVSVDGWQLSETEAQLAAYIAEIVLGRAT